MFCGLCLFFVVYLFDLFCCFVVFKCYIEQNKRYQKVLQQLENLKEEYKKQNNEILEHKNSVEKYANDARRAREEVEKLTKILEVSNVELAKTQEEKEKGKKLMNGLRGVCVLCFFF